MHTPDGQREQPQRVLVVDDEETIRIALERGLKRLGLEVLHACDGATALPIAVEQRPEVLLLDLRMPGIDGHTFLRRLAETDCDAAVVVISGQGDMEDVVDVLRAGAVDYLKKPWQSGELIAAVTRALEIHESRRRLRRLERADAVPISLPVAAPVPPIRLPDRTSPAPAPAVPRAVTDPFEMVVAKLRNGEIPIPPVPSVITELRTMVRQPDTDADQVAAKIEQDQRIAADVIRLSNSAQYARHGRNTSIKTALMRIGFQQVHTLVETAFLQNMFVVNDPQFRARLSQLWGRSVAQAMSMRSLAHLLAVDDRVQPDTAYLSGLMSDIGGSLLLWLIAERTPQELTGRGEQVALRIIRAHHTELGARLLGQWGFDPLVTQVVTEHHAERAPSSHPLYWSMAMVSSEMTDEICGGADPTAAVPRDPALLDRCKGDLRLSRTTLARVKEEVRREHASVLQTLG